MIAIAIAALALASPIAAPAAPAARDASDAKIEVSSTTDLTEGQAITITGSGFRPGLKGVAVGLCKEGYANGLTDCDLEGGATFVNIDAEGRLPEVKLTTRPKFNEIDCMTQQCVIGAAPLPDTVPPAVITANTGIVQIGFKGSKFKGGAAVRTSAAPAADTGPGTGGPSIHLWAATAALIVIAGAAVTIVQRRSR